MKFILGNYTPFSWNAHPTSPQEVEFNPTQIVLKIQRLVCNFSGLPISIMTQKYLTAGTLYYRKIGMYLCKKYSHLNYRELAELFGSDHATVWRACQDISYRRKQDRKLDLFLVKCELILSGELTPPG